MAATGMSILNPKTILQLRQDEVAGRVRLGFIGVGQRGRDHILEGLLRDDVEITTICDTQDLSLRLCNELFEKAGKTLPVSYTGGLDAYKKLLDRKDLDGVLIATPWQFHKDQAVDAMKSGKRVGCEVIAGISIDDHWEIVKVSEQTGVPYMTLENVCYRRDVMAVLRMVREGLFGELIHLEGGYQHNLRGFFFNDGKSVKAIGTRFGPKAVDEAQWRTQFNIDRNGDIYPTHGAGPILHYAKINKGNRFTNLVSFAFKSRGPNAYVNNIDPASTAATINYKNGDVITTLINCAGVRLFCLVTTLICQGPTHSGSGFKEQMACGWMWLNQFTSRIKGNPMTNGMMPRLGSILRRYLRNQLRTETRLRLFLILLRDSGRLPGLILP